MSTEYNDIAIQPTISSAVTSEMSKAYNDIEIQQTEQSYDSAIGVRPSYQSSVISMQSSYVKHEMSAHSSVLYTESASYSSSISVKSTFDLQSSLSYKPSVCPSTLSVQESNDPSVSTEFTNNSVICMEPEPERICIQDTEPENICVEDTAPNEEEPLDDESFLNSLDLERLVIVVKQINGKDFYDIHETDGDMQNLSDKPLNLPRHIVDLIVDAMTQDD
jgi:hypothetical protein